MLTGTDFNVMVLTGFSSAMTYAQMNMAKTREMILSQVSFLKKFSRNLPVTANVLLSFEKNVVLFSIFLPYLSRDLLAEPSLCHVYLLQELMKFLDIEISVEHSFMCERYDSVFLGDDYYVCIRDF